MLICQGSVCNVCLHHHGYVVQVAGHPVHAYLGNFLAELLVQKADFLKKGPLRLDRRNIELRFGKLCVRESVLNHRAQLDIF